MTSSDPQATRVGAPGLDLERLTYATVAVMAVLAAYNGWDTLSYPVAVLTVLSPVLAVALAHLFSELLEELAAHRRTLAGSEWVALARRQAPLLLAAVPPLIVLTFGRATSIRIAATRPVEEITGLVTLVFLSAIASRRAGLRRARLVLASLAGGLVGLVVIMLQIALKPH